MLVCDTVDPVIHAACMNLMDIETLLYAQHGNEGYSYTGFAEFYSARDFDRGQTVSHLTTREMRLIHEALVDIAYAYSRAYSKSVEELLNPTDACSHVIDLINSDISLGSSIGPYEIFHMIHPGKVKFIKYAGWPDQGRGRWWGEVAGPTTVKLFLGAEIDSRDPDAFYPFISFTNPEITDNELDSAYKRFIIHEMGHVFDSIMNEEPRREVGLHPELITGEDPYELNGFYGPKNDGWQWRLTAQRNYAYEIFADQFIGWVYDKWETDLDGDLVDDGVMRRDFMNEYMTQWITDKVVRGGG
jgi:hypothetical protein